MQLYKATWTLMTTKSTLRDQFNATASELSKLDLELLEIPRFQTETFTAVVAGDLFNIFTMITRLGYAPRSMMALPRKRELRS